MRGFKIKAGKEKKMSKERKDKCLREGKEGMDEKQSKLIEKEEQINRKYDKSGREE